MVGRWANQHGPVARVSAATPGTACGESPGCRCAHPGYQSLRCPTGRTPHRSVNARRRKYSTLPKFGNNVFVASPRPKEEGRIAIVTNAGRGAVDVDHTGAKGFAGRATVSDSVTPTTGAVRVRQNRVVLASGVCTPSLAVMWQPNRVCSISHPQGDGGNSASLPGESTT